MKRMVLPFAAVMMVPTAVSAQDDAMEELKQILETQFSAETESVVGEYLGMDALQEAFEASGVQVQAQFGLTEETGALLEGTLPEGVYLNFGFQQDPNARQWLLSLGAGLEEESLLDVSLYGDESMLSLSLPQFYSGALGLRAGSFLEQYTDSALAEMLGIGDLGIDDFNMSFYPEDVEADVEEGSLEAEITENMQQAVDEFMASGFSLTKSEAEDGTTYTAVVETNEVLDLYKAFMEEYLDMLDEMGILDLYVNGVSASTGYSTDNLDLYEMIETSLEEMSEAMADEGTMTFYVQEDLLQCVTYQIDIYETEDEYEAEDMSEETYETEVADTTADEPVGNILVSFVLDDPAQPDGAFTLQIQAKGYESEETAAIQISRQTERTDTLTETTIGVQVLESDELLYEDTVYRLSFDTATGELDLMAGVTDPDSGEYAGLKMTSVFHDVVPGSSFGWTLEELSFVAEGESVGLTGEISVQADPGTIEAQDPAMILEMDEDELTSLLVEVYMNALTWVDDAQSIWNEALGIEPETEDDDYYWYDDSDDEYLYDDDYWYGTDDDEYWYGDDSDDEYRYGDETESIVSGGVSA